MRNDHYKRRVVVTGLGMVSPIGHTVDETWQALLRSQSGIALIDHFDTSHFSVRIAACVKDFDPTRYMSTKDARRNDAFIHYAVAAVTQALADAQLDITEALSHRIGTAIGSGIGGLPMIEAARDSVVRHQGPRRLSPFAIPGLIINMASGYSCIKHQLRGPNIAIVTACTSGTHNIGMAARMIAYGDADVMVCGGSEMAISPVAVGGFAAMRALSTRNDAPEQASRPWDKDRDGFVLGSGAGMLVLEAYDFAKKRGVPIYAELAGFGMSCDAYHITSPDPQGEGAKRAMSLALADAELNPDQVDYINAHATSTIVGDELELLAISQLFGQYQSDLAISSTKSMTGHLIGAAGAIEAIFSILSIRDQVVPPTINLDDPSSVLPMNFVPHQPQSLAVNVAMSNSFGFGGTNGSLVFKKLN